MQYAARLPDPRALVVPVLALAIGAAGATGAYALLDDESVVVRPAPIAVTETPSAPMSGGKDEAATAAAIGTAGPSVSSTGKDEAATAAAIGGGVDRGEAGSVISTDPFGPEHGIR